MKLRYGTDELVGVSILISIFFQVFYSKVLRLSSFVEQWH